MPDVFAHFFHRQELLNRRPPYAEYQSFAVAIPISQGKLPEFSDEIKQMRDRCITALCLIFAQCWKPAGRRPDMDRIVQVLENVLLRGKMSLLASTPQYAH